MNPIITDNAARLKMLEWKEGIRGCGAGYGCCHGSR